MEIRELRAFVVVVEQGGVSAAARRLHISQPSLSQTVQSLERQLGGQLLIRDHNGVRPTDRGAALLVEARGLIRYHDRVVSAVTDIAGPTNPHTAPLRVGVPLELPADLLPPAIAHVTSIHPKLTVQLRHCRSTAQITALKADDLDVALVRDHPADPHIDAVLAVQEPLGVILTADLSREIAEPDGVRLDRLRRLRWIGFARADAPAWHDQVHATLRGHGVTTTDTAGDDDRPVTPEVKLAAAGTGQAFALASQHWAQPLPSGLTWHRLIGNPLVRRTWACWPADSRRRELASLIAALDPDRQLLRCRPQGVGPTKLARAPKKAT